VAGAMRVKIPHTQMHAFKNIAIMDLGCKCFLLITVGEKPLVVPQPLGSCCPEEIQ
jgi:hypothetical protein